MTLNGESGRMFQCYRDISDISFMGFTHHLSVCIENRRPFSLAL